MQCSRSSDTSSLLTAASALQAEMVLLLNKLTASLAVHAASLALEAQQTEDSKDGAAQVQHKVERPASGPGLAERLSQVCGRPASPCGDAAHDA